jgi:hypothetical protein
MRVRDPPKKPRAPRISRRIAAAMALCGVAMPGMAAAVELVQPLPHLWVSAAALSLTLVTAATRPKN